jgi:hypothetical protein
MDAAKSVTATFNIVSACGLPQGEIVEGARLRAVRQIAQSKDALMSVSPATVGETWTPIGPAPILGGQIGTAMTARPMSGRIGALAADPGNPSHWIAGAAQGGVWETRDAGVTWTPKTDHQPSLAVGAVAFAPSHPSIIYAGTGEANNSGDSYGGTGLLKSLDGGATWTLLAASTFTNTAFSALSVDPTNPNRVLAATMAGFAEGTAAPPLDSPPTGILTSPDGGTTWCLMLPGTASALVAHPTDFARQYAGVGDIYGDATNGVYRSLDTGKTWIRLDGPWSAMAGGVGRVELAVAPSAPATLYVSVQDALDGVGTDGGLLGLWRTDNAWDPTPTWTRIPTGKTDDGTGAHGYCGWDYAFGLAPDQCWFSHTLTVDPANAGTLYAGGVALWKCTSCDATPQWSEISKTKAKPSKGIHANQQRLAWAGSRLLVGNDGGVWSTTDRGDTWLDHNTTLAITQFYAGALHPTDAGMMLGGSQGTGTARRVGTDAWQPVFGGNGTATVLSSAYPETHWAISTQRLSIWRTRDGGASFEAATTGLDRTGAPFVARVEKCPVNDDVLLAGGDRLWRTDDFFSADTPTWADNGAGAVPDGITALAFAPSDPTCRTYAVGARTGVLRLTTDGGSTWTDVNAGHAIPGRAVTDLAFDPTNASVLYVTLADFDEETAGQPGHVFKTTNALSGAPTWVDVSPPVNLPHNTIAVDPGDSAVVYVGTDLGVWKSGTGGGAWTHLGPETGMPNVAVYDLKIHQVTRRVVAFTHGRGAFILVPAGSGP